MKCKLFISFLIFCSSLTLCFGAEKRFSFAVKGGYYAPSSSTFNNESVPATNQELRTLASTFQGIDFSTTYNEMEKLGGSLTYGFEFELFIWRNLSVAGCTEYWQKSLSASLDSSGMEEGHSYAADLELNWKGSLIPILGTVRYTIPYEKFRIYAGGGVGYYLGKIAINGHIGFSSNGDQNEINRNLESKGHSILPHINGGFDYKITDFIWIGCDLRYTIGKIESFKITKGSYEPLSSEPTDVDVEGNELTFADENGELKIFKWELSGFNFATFLRFKF